MASPCRSHSRSSAGTSTGISIRESLLSKASAKAGEARGAGGAGRGSASTAGSGDRAASPVAGPAWSGDSDTDSGPGALSTALEGCAIRDVPSSGDDSDSDRYWIVEAAIPLANFKEFMPKTPPTAGSTWNLNLHRHGGETNMQYSQWSPGDTPEPAFHTPHRFGRVVFSEETLPFGR